MTRKSCPPSDPRPATKKLAKRVGAANIPVALAKMRIGTCWKTGSGKKFQRAIRRARKEIDPDPVDAVAIAADAAVTVGAVVVIAAREVEMIDPAPEIARLAMKFVRPNQLRVPAVPSARAAQPVSVRHDRVVVIVRQTTAVHDETIVLAADAVGTAMTGPATIVRGKNRVVPRRRLRVLLLRRSQRRISETGLRLTGPNLPRG